MPQRFIPPFTRNEDLMSRETKRLERTEQERTGGGVHAVRRVIAFYPVYLEAGGRRGAVASCVGNADDASGSV